MKQKYTLVVIYGLPCTGKTSIAKPLTDLLNAKFLQIDNIWDSLFKEPKYTSYEANLVFNELVKHCRTIMVEHRRNLVVEGVFATKNRIVRLEEISNRLGYKLITVLLQANEETIEQRLNKRNNKGQKVQMETVRWLSQKMDSRDAADIQLYTDNSSLSNAKKSIIRKIIKKLPKNQKE